MRVTFLTRRKSTELELGVEYISHHLKGEMYEGVTLMYLAHDRNKSGRLCERAYEHTSLITQEEHYHQLIWFVSGDF